MFRRCGTDVIWLYAALYVTFLFRKRKRGKEGKGELYRCGYKRAEEKAVLRRKFRNGVMCKIAPEGATHGA